MLTEEGRFGNPLNWGSRIYLHPCCRRYRATKLELKARAGAAMTRGKAGIELYCRYYDVDGRLIRWQDRGGCEVSRLFVQRWQKVMEGLDYCAEFAMEWAKQGRKYRMNGFGFANFNFG